MSNEQVTVFKGDGGYGRDATVVQEISRCDKCACVKNVLSFDSSEGEYASFTFCQSCLDSLFASGGVAIHE